MRLRKHSPSIPFSLTIIGFYWCRTMKRYLDSQQDQLWLVLQKSWAMGTSSKHWRNVMQTQPVSGPKKLVPTTGQGRRSRPQEVEKAEEENQMSGINELLFNFEVWLNYSGGYRFCIMESHLLHVVGYRSQNNTTGIVSENNMTTNWPERKP